MASVVEKNIPPIGTTVEDLCQQYSQYLLLVDILKDGERKVDNVTEGVLTRLDEFGTLIETIRNDNNTIVEELVPRILEGSKELSRIFQLIDELQGFIQIVAKKVQEAEEKVTIAENAYNAMNRSHLLAYIPGVKFSDEMPRFSGLEFDTAPFFNKYKTPTASGASGASGGSGGSGPSLFQIPNSSAPTSSPNNTLNPFSTINATNTAQLSNTTNPVQLPSTTNPAQLQFSDLLS